MQQLGEQQIPTIEGFNEKDQLQPNKEREKRISMTGFFAIPEAKPLLAKNYVDWTKPKTLIREIRIKREPIQGRSCRVAVGGGPRREIQFKGTQTQFKGTQIGVQGTQIDAQGQESTLWDRFLLSGKYRCLYAKYFVGRLQDYQQGGNKRLRLQLLKNSKHNPQLFATPIIDLSFLSESSNISLLKNLLECSLQNFMGEEVQDDVQFDSRWECGNLGFVFQKMEKQQAKVKQYWLVLENDVNTKGYANWFYFSVRAKQMCTIKLNIVNLQKPFSLYSSGMRPYVLSLSQSDLSDLSNHNSSHNNSQNHPTTSSWQPGGSNIRYVKNEFMKADKTHYSTLSFDLQVNGLIFIAATLPYSYSRVISFAETIQKISRVNSNVYLKREVLGMSLSSNQCPMLTLTWKREKAARNASTVVPRKKIIVVIARQHPCETVSSYVLQGLVNYLVYLKGEAAVQLLKQYIFKIVCMVNVDGVIYGNGRCDINGADTNRKWSKSPNNALWPILSNLNKQINSLVSSGYQIQYFIDLHGHSKKYGFFIYACPTQDQVESYVFPFVMSKLNSKFNLAECKVGLSKGKQSTARGWANSIVSKRVMTVETSFHGYAHGSSSINANANDGLNQKIMEYGSPKNEKNAWQMKDLHGIGQTLMEGIYTELTRDSSIVNWQTLKTEIKDYLAEKSQGKKMSKGEGQDGQSGSDSSPSQDELDEKEAAATFLPLETSSKLGLLTKKDQQPNLSNQAGNSSNQANKNQSNGQRQLKDTGKYQGFIIGGINSETLTKNNKIIAFRETKSVTKIEPFKFSASKEKHFPQTKETGASSSSMPKVIRIAIDIRHHKSKDIEERAVPPAKPKDFWQSLKKQYQSLVQEKKKVISLSTRKTSHRMLHLLKKC